MEKQKLLKRLHEAEQSLDNAIIDIFRLQTKVAELTHTEPPSFPFTYNSYIAGFSVDNYHPPYSQRLK